MKTQIVHQSFSFYAWTRSENWLTIVLVSKASLFSMLLVVVLAAGHSSKSRRFEKLQEYAFTYTFIIKSLDIIPPDGVLSPGSAISFGPSRSS
ncbi:hypothetical protein VitviT2T_022835 [Vitis vinifera]|uniref:Uncharacterized protein n=1 Tax=Vitis vinifera TaxID=29760 RepID=A0ABY9DB08_VITVI|nr:hypothetical protein VitviT2T_022835 [Vitis vinifera]